MDICVAEELSPVFIGRLYLGFLRNCNTNRRKRTDNKAEAFRIYAFEVRKNKSELRIKTSLNLGIKHIAVQAANKLTFRKKALDVQGDKNMSERKNMKKNNAGRLLVLSVAAMLCIASAACGKKQEKGQAPSTASDTVTESINDQKQEETLSSDQAGEHSDTEETRITVYENNVFSVRFIDGSFEIDESRINEDTVSFVYSGESEHPVSLTVSYEDGRNESEIVSEALIITDDSRIIVNDKSNVSFTEQEVSLIQKETIGADGIACYSTLYVFPYAKGSICIVIEDYFEENNDIAMSFSGAMEMLVNTLSFKEPGNGIADMDGEADAAAAESTAAGIANPWITGTQTEIETGTGLTLAVPKTAENVSFAMLEGEKMEQMTFEIEGVSYCARAKAGENEDISGMYYDWEQEENSMVAYCDAVIKTAFVGDEKAEVCIWYDMVPGVAYSLSTLCNKDENSDIRAVAEQVFVSLQGDAG